MLSYRSRKRKLTLLTGETKMCSKTQGYYQTTEEIKMSLTIEQKLSKLHHDFFEDKYTGIIDAHYFELSHNGAKWECKVTGIYVQTADTRFNVWGPNPIKALNEAMKNLH